LVWALDVFQRHLEVDLVVFPSRQVRRQCGQSPEERAALVAARPDVFFLPRESELRFHWIEAWLDALDADEMRELVLDAWRMVVPQRVAREVLGPPAAGHKPGHTG
jgi:hypothetical protein